jgi:DNA topoisomerase-1
MPASDPAAPARPPTRPHPRARPRPTRRVRELSAAITALAEPAVSSPLAPGELPPGLVWTCDREPGLRRQRRGDDWVYHDEQGRRVTDEQVLQRIRRLAIPPAYEDVWICARADGHLQATGRDARGRKQYRYHAAWQAGRGADKFARLREFGAALPRIRGRVQRDLDAAMRRDRVSRELVLATLVRLLDTTFIRVGNEAYAQANGSFGLTTLRCRHAEVGRTTLRLRFIGKSGVQHDLRLDDRRVVSAIRRCRELPGQELFCWQDDEGDVHRVTSSDVNDYLAEAAGTRVTAKDFRTWHGSVIALDLVIDAARATEAPKGAVRAIVAQVAQRLGNTAAVCRKAYIHPQALACAEALEHEDTRADLLAAPWIDPSSARAARHLRAAERRLLALLAHRERAEARARRRLARRGLQ